MGRSRLAVALQVAVALLVVAFVIRSFMRHWDQFRSSALELKLLPLPLLMAMLIIWLGYLLLVFAWRRVVVGWDQKLPLATALRIWSWSSLGKYLPGKVWAVAGMVVMAREAGVAVWAATGSAFLLQGLALGSGLVVMISAGGSLLGGLDTAAMWGLGLTAVATGFVVALAVKPGMMVPLLRRFTGREDLELAPVSRGDMLLGLIANLAAWLCYGTAVWLLARALMPQSVPGFLSCVSAFTAAYVVGFVTLVVPGGIGVREGLLVVLLEPQIGLPAASTLAVASRLLFTATEIGIAVPFLFAPKGFARV